LTGILGSSVSGTTALTIAAVSPPTPPEPNYALAFRERRAMRFIAELLIRILLSVELSRVQTAFANLLVSSDGHRFDLGIQLFGIHGINYCAGSAHHYS
jgi:hypothetical protein